jgi:hypothetical protein
MSIYSKPPLPQDPFTREGIPLFPSNLADELEEIIPTMGAQGPNPLTSPIPVRVEEQNEVNERHAIPTTTTPTYYDLVTTDPKDILLLAESQDHLVDFNQQITTDSPKIFASGNLKVPGKGITRIWAQTVTSTGTLRILVFKR